MLVDIGNEDPEWGAVEEEMQSTIRFDQRVLFNQLLVFFIRKCDLEDIHQQYCFCP